MTEFRFPHPYDNVKEAIDKADDGLTGSLSNLAVQLLDENNRAVEDAINGVDITGLSGGENFESLTESQPGELTWTLPGTTDTFMANISVSAAALLTSGAVLYLLVDNRVVTAVADGSLQANATASMTLYSGPYDLTVFWTDAGNPGDFTLSLEFSAIKVG